MEVVLEDQILYADSMEEVASNENPIKKLLKKEQRLTAKLQEEQEAEGRAQDRFQQAQTRLQRRRKRLERIQGKLSLVREQLAELQITDQVPVYRENEHVIVPTSESSTNVDSEQVTLIQPQQEAPTPELVSPAPVEALVESELETTPEERSDVELFEQEQEPVSALDSIAVESETEVKDGVNISSETNTERKPTKPLQLEQPGPPVAESHSSDVQSAKEAWIAAESAMQNARNAVNGIATSIAFPSQTDGLSNELMEELVRKQADANKELLKAQDAARAAYERFVQAQRDSQSAANRLVDVSTNTSEGPSQQKQEHVSLPPAEENGVDQTAKLHAVRLYTEW
jgi:chromosome segregation ATPase